MKACFRLHLLFLSFVVIAASLMAREHCKRPPWELPLKCSSPAGTKRLVHHGFDPYGPEPEPASFELYAKGTEELVHTFELRDFGRAISEILWVDNRFALIRGEAMFYAILDTERLRVSTQFLGASATASPAADAVAFRFPAIPRYGPDEVREKTDRVAIGWSPRESATEGAAGGAWKYWQVYPDLVPLRAGRGPEEPVVHKVTTPLTWSPEGHRVAFGGESDAGTFLLVVTVPRGEGEKPQVKRFLVPNGEEAQAGSEQPASKIDGLSWKPDGKLIEVKTSTGTRNFEVPPVDSPSG